MSLVNDMLRDLEARRAPPAERAALDGLQPVDEGGAAARAARRRQRWLALCALGLGLLAAAGLAGVWPPAADLPPTPPAEAVAPVVASPPPAATLSAEPAPAPVRLLATLPQHGAGRFVLQLLLDRAPDYRRSEQSGAVSLQLPGLQLRDGGPREGRFEHAGRSLGWSLAAQGDGAELLLVGLGDELQVFDRLEPAGERWQLWVEVPFGASDDFDPARLPVAGAEEAAVDYPAERPAAPAAASAPLRASPVARLAPAPPPPVVARAPEAHIASHRPDALGEARQALLAGEQARALGLLEALHQRQPDNLEALRWLARALLGGGQGERLLELLPAKLQRFPQDSELRLLLARAQLQAGDSAAAVETLARRLPPLAADPAYHALLAAAYQQAGRWRESAERYRELILLNPAQGAWQLGLAIALEQLGERVSAAGHYRRAVQGQGLDDSSRQYAGERLQAIGGRE